MVIKGESDSSSEIIFFFAGSFITIAVGGAILCFWRKKKLKSQNSLLAGQDYLS